MIGAAAEGGIDAASNEAQWNRIQEAYDNQTPIVPVDPNNPEGELRPLTEEEFKQAGDAMNANRAGSGGRAVGSGLGASGGAALGVAMTSWIPIPGARILGGLVGAIVGSVAGGRAGDKAATDVMNNAEGIEDPQAYIDNLAKNLPDLDGGQLLTDANIDVADAQAENRYAGNNQQNISSNTDNSRREEYNYYQVDVQDDANLALST